MTFLENWDRAGRRLLDMVEGGCHDDRMIASSTPNQDPQERPIALPLAGDQLAELLTHPDFDALVDKVIDRVQAVFSEDFEEEVVDLVVECFSADGVDPIDSPMDFLCDLEGEVWDRVRVAAKLRLHAAWYKMEVR